MSRRLTLAVALLGLLAVLAPLTGCGVPTDAAPRNITVEDEEPPPATVPVAPGAGHVASQTIYLVRPQERGFALEPVPYSVEPTIDPSELARQLVEGLATARRDQPALDPGVQTKVPADVQVRSVELRDEGILAIDFSKELGAVENELLRQALAQIVFTATAVPGVRGVVIKIDGDDRTVPLQDSTGASATGAPLTRQSFPTVDTQVRSTEAQPGEG